MSIKGKKNRSHISPRITFLKKEAAGQNECNRLTTITIPFIGMYYVVLYGYQPSIVNYVECTSRYHILLTTTVRA